MSDAIPSPGGSTALLEAWRQTLGPGVVLDSLSTEQSYRPRPACGDAPSPPQPPALEVGAELGRGGMGVVYRARQASLEREVALKTLRQSGRDSDAGRALAFVSEAVTQGRLEHPNIVPVHDLGYTAAGELQLAMKLVEGQSWSRRLKEGGASLAEHLGILLQVCNAVALAHSHEIAHCDLKPANVMLGRFGEVLLTDWGLAVSFAAAPELPLRHRSQVTSPCGTPSYMAPELAEGRGEAIGPWTDVYLLGGILYAILHGRPPHTGATFFQVVTQAVLGRLPPLREDLPEEARSLLKSALAPKPEERCSVADFQQRLRRYLGHRESLEISAAARASLDACRQRASEAAGLDATGRSELYTRFSEAIAGFGSARRLWEGNPEAIAGEREACLAFARTALQLADLNLAETQLARLDAGPERAGLTRQLEEARKSRRADLLARRRLRRTLALGSLLLLTGLGLAYWLQSRTVAELRAREREVAEQNRQLEDGARRLAQQIAWAERRGHIAEGALNALADKVQGRLTHELGDAHSQRVARELLDIALAGWEELREARADEGGRSEGAAFTLLQIGLLERLVDGDLERALAMAEEARGIYAELVAAAPADPVLRLDFVQACLHIAEIQRLRGALDAAEANLEQVLPQLGMLAADTVDASVQRIHAQVYKTAAAVAVLRGELGAARDNFARTVEIARASWQRDPDNLAALRELIEGLSNLGAAQGDAGGHREALATFAAADTLLADARARLPGNVQLRLQACLLGLKAARLRYEQGETAGAIGEARGLLAALEAILASNPENWHYRQYVASARNDLGEMLAVAGAVEESREVLESSLVLLRTLGSIDPSHVNVARLRAQAARLCGETLWKLGESAAAGPLLREALALSERLSADDSTSFLLRRQLSASHGALGRWHLRRGRLDSARVALETALAIDRALFERVPENPRARHDLSASCLLLAEALAIDGEDARAAALVETAVDLRSPAAEAEPDNLYLARSLAVARERQAQLMQSAGDPRAFETLRAAVEGYGRLADADAGNLRAQLDFLHGALTLAEWEGSGPSALARAEACVARMRELRADFPASAELRDYYAEGCRILANQLLGGGDYARAEGLLGEAQALQRALVAASPADMALADQHARLCHKRGSLLLLLERPEQAGEAAAEALAVREAMFEAMDGHPAIAFRIARTAGLAGQAALQARDFEKAEAVLERGLFHQDRLDPREPGARGNLARLLLLFGELYAARDELDAAEQVFAAVPELGLDPALLAPRRADLAWRQGRLDLARELYVAAGEPASAALAALAAGARAEAEGILAEAAGDPEAAVWRAALGAEAPAADGWAGARLAWLRGELGFDALLARADAVPSAAFRATRRCQAEALRGLRAWSLGDAEEARAAFAACAACAAPERPEARLAAALAAELSE